MIQIMRSNQRGFRDHGWLKSYHTFSFADYINRNAMGFRSLRVINEDYIAPDMGFGTHPHNDMEIISYVVSGQLAHRDSMGNTKIVKSGEVQAMSAGSGVTHSEFNPSKDMPTHLLQIWILPRQKNLSPTYAEWKSSSENAGLTLIAAPDGKDGSVRINQDASLFLGNFTGQTEADYHITDARHVWVQIIEGTLQLNGETLESGDAAAISEIEELALRSPGDTKFLLFDLN